MGATKALIFVPIGTAKHAVMRRNASNAMLILLTKNSKEGSHMESGQDALNFFEPQCGQCHFWRTDTLYVVGGRKCQQPDSPEFGKRKSILSRCTFFAYKGG